MQIIINLEPGNTETLSRATKTEFIALGAADFDKNNDQKVIVVVRNDKFTEDLEKTSPYNLPLIVVAGSEDAAGKECINKARAFGVPDGCIIVKRKETVFTIDGREIAPAVRQGKGIGARAVVEAATYALENNLRPEPVVWEEKTDDLMDATLFEEPEKEAVTVPTANHAKTTENKPAQIVPLRKPFIGEFKDILEATEQVIAVFRSTPAAESGIIAMDLARQLRGTHIEVSASPQSYKYYGDNQGETSSPGYMHSNGTELKGEPTDLNWLVIEVDPTIPYPEAMDMVYKKAKNIVHVVGAGAVEDSKNAVNAWINSGWKIDAVIPDKQNSAHAFKDFGKILFSDTKTFLKQIQAGL